MLAACGRWINAANPCSLMKQDNKYCGRIGSGEYKSDDMSFWPAEYIHCTNYCRMHLHRAISKSNAAQIREYQSEGRNCLV